MLTMVKKGTSVERFEQLWQMSVQNEDCLIQGDFTEREYFGVEHSVKELSAKIGEQVVRLTSWEAEWQCLSEHTLGSLEVFEDISQ